MFSFKKDAWMFKKKIQMNITTDGKTSVQFITVHNFVKMYNKLEPMFNETKKLSEDLLGELYTVDRKMNTCSVWVMPYFVLPG